MTVTWLVAAPFVPMLVAIELAIGALFGIPLPRSDDSDGPAPPG